MISCNTRTHLSALILENYWSRISLLLSAAGVDSPEPERFVERETTIVEFVSSLGNQQVFDLIRQVCKQRRIIRAAAPRKGVFDDRWSLFEDALHVDGYRLAPDGSIEATEVLPLAQTVSYEKLENLIDQLPTELAESVRRLLSDAEQALNDASYETVNGAVAIIRTALESVYRHYARLTLENDHGEQTPSWGRALQLLRQSSLISKSEERALSSHYTLMSEFHAELLPDRRDEFAFHRAISIFWILFIIERQNRRWGGNP